MGRRNKAARAHEDNSGGFLDNLGPVGFALTGFAAGLLGVLVWFLLTQSQSLPPSAPVHPARSNRNAPASGRPPSKTPLTSPSDARRLASEAEVKRQAAYQHLMRGDRDQARTLLFEALALSDVFSDNGAEYTFYNGLGWSLSR